jgi:serine/threonine-protein kinase PRP4
MVLVPLTQLTYCHVAWPLVQDVIKKVQITKPSRDLRARLMPPASAQIKEDERKLLAAFVDLLDRCLALDPARRITPKEALVHPFIRG